MKAASKLVVLISLGMLGAIAASAATSEQIYLDSCRKGPGVPVPISVVSPNVGPEYTGASVEIEFTVDQTGKPAAIKVPSSVDGTLADAMVSAVKQWKFKPAERGGVPVATRVVLPVKVIDSFLAGSSFASN